MKKSIKIITNKVNGYKFVAILTDDEVTFVEKSADLIAAKEAKIIFMGESNDVLKIKNTIREGTPVDFYYNQEWSSGIVTSLAGMPYYEVKPNDKPKNRYSINKRFIKNKEISLKYILDNFVAKISEARFKKYDLGIVKSESKFFRTPEASLMDLFKRGKFVILYKI